MVVKLLEYSLLEYLFSLFKTGLSRLICMLPLIKRLNILASVVKISKELKPIVQLHCN